MDAESGQVLATGLGSSKSPGVIEIHDLKEAAEKVARRVEILLQRQATPWRIELHHVPETQPRGRRWGERVQVGSSA
jgi:hypothetical protein